MGYGTEARRNERGVLWLCALPARLETLSAVFADSTAWPDEPRQKWIRSLRPSSILWIQVPRRSSPHSKWSLRLALAPLAVTHSPRSPPRDSQAVRDGLASHRSCRGKTGFRGVPSLRCPTPARVPYTAYRLVLCFCSLPPLSLCDSSIASTQQPRSELAGPREAAPERVSFGVRWSSSES